jgi:hypothetical protein
MPLSIHLRDSPDKNRYLPFDNLTLKIKLPQSVIKKNILKKSRKHGFKISLDNYITSNFENKISKTRGNMNPKAKPAIYGLPHVIDISNTTI